MTQRKEKTGTCKSVVIATVVAIRDAVKNGFHCIAHAHHDFFRPPPPLWSLSASLSLSRQYVQYTIYLYDKFPSSSKLTASLKKIQHPLISSNMYTENMRIHRLFDFENEISFGHLLKRSASD